MGKAAPVPVPEPSGPFDMLKDFFLFSGDFKWAFYFTLIGFCAANGRAILTATPKINYFHGCALMVLANFGGSTMAAIMCGEPVPFVCNEALVSCCLTVWTVMYLMPSATVSFLKDNPVGSILTSITYEIQRCHVAMNCTKMASGVLPGRLAQPAADRVPIIGPLIAGTLGGCGGGFMPLNKGLDPLANGTNWRIGSAIVNSIWMHLSMQHPAAKAAIGLSVDMCRFLSVLFFVSVPLLESLSQVQSPFGANPLITVAPSDKKKK